MVRRLRDSSGVTLVELMVTMVILSILAACILPLSEVSRKRSREIELRQCLREIRSALDEYKRYADDGKLAKQAADNGYPQDLEVLVKGVDLAGPVPVKKKFLRRIPKDPMTEEGQWGLRSYSDEPDSEIWGGQDVYDVYSKSDEVALDGTPYNQW
ncbi:MAG: general secretion pathway protein GspG [Deltaproteobacteria bacterium HGW-Deltaproteobacteria-21]|nr:MAG: general secretion pathway protein GspG [Deltaproteobacteria bacterium HGW-Deltaproteobacteria-21]